MTEIATNPTTTLAAESQARALDLAVARAMACLRPEPPAAEVTQIQADIETCGRALHELVTAIMAYDSANPPAPATGGAIKLRWHGETALDRLAFESLTGHPVRYALREGVKRIGREIYHLGGSVGAMADSADRVAEMDPPHAGRRAAIINSAWDGIGKGEDRWWS